MSNYHPGAQYDSAAPWNEPRRRTEWKPWYVMAGGPNEENHTLQIEVFFPAHCDGYEARHLARCYCADHKLDFVDLEKEEDSHYATIKTDCYYE